MYLNLTQVAESLGVSEKVVEDWMRNESLPHTPDGGRLLFDRAQVAHWAAARGLAAKVGFLAPDSAAFATGWRIEPLLRAGGIWREIPADGVLEALRRVVGSLPGATPAIRQLLAQRLATADGLNFAPIGAGFALPHLRTRLSLGRDSGTVALLLLKDGLKVSEPAPDRVPITRLFFFVAPSPRAHLDLVGRLCRLLLRGPLRELVLRGAADADIFGALAAAEPAGEGGFGEGKAR
jgi:PTS system nitrogen regulatory IIA component